MEEILLELLRIQILTRFRQRIDQFGLYSTGLSACLPFTAAFLSMEVGLGTGYPQSQD